MRVKDIMSQPAVTCTPLDTLAVAAGLMWDANCGSLPVVAEGRVVGVITDRDICMAAFVERRLLADIPVSRAMATDVVCCGPEDTIHHAEELLVEHQIRRLPVIAESGEIVGVLSIDDLAREGARERREGDRRQISSAEIVDTLASVSESRVSEIKS